MNRFKFFSLWLLIASSMPLSYAHAGDALLVHPAGGFSAAGSALDNIQRITFSGGDMSVKSFSGNVDVYILDDVAKITFGDLDITDITTLPVPGFDVVVYVTPAGEIVVESSVVVQSLTLFNVDGKIVRVCNVESLQTTLNASSLPTGIYILKIKTEEGIITKKLIINK